MRAETEWLAAIAQDTAIRVPVPVVNAAEEAVTEVEVDGVPGRRSCVLFRWLPGRQLDRSLERANLAAYGALAARLHDHAGGFRPSPGFAIVRYDRVFPFEEPVVLLDPARAAFVTDAQREVFAAGVERVGRAIEDLARREPMRVIHGDLHRWNVLVDHRSRALDADPSSDARTPAASPAVAGVPTLAAIDFEDLMWGWPVQDLATALYYLADEPRYPELVEAFRAGYESVRAWPDVAGDGVETFIAGRALVLANDVELLEELEYRANGPEYMARFERRVRRLLGR